MSGHDDNRTPAWMQRKERGSLFWLRFMQRLSLLAGRPATRPIVYCIALYFLCAVAPARAALRGYLPRVLGRPASWRDLYRHILSFASTIHDRTFLVADRFDAFSIRNVGVEAIHERHARDGGFLLFGAHLGSFEVMRSQARQRPDLKVCMAMFPDNAQHINAALAALNPAAMANLIPLGRLDSMLMVHNRLQEGSMVGILADRASGEDASFETLDFLGSPAHFPTGPFRMAAMLRQPVYFMAGLYKGGNRYELVFEPIADFSEVGPKTRDAAIRAAVTSYARTLERHCRAAPYNWFNFYDFWESARADAVPTSAP
jgi:predicted LPLAT superfamily acyltransferase